MLCTSVNYDFPMDEGASVMRPDCHAPTASADDTVGSTFGSVCHPLTRAVVHGGVILCMAALEMCMLVTPCGLFAALSAHLPTKRAVKDSRFCQASRSCWDASECFCMHDALCMS